MNVVFRPVVSTTLILMYVPTVKRDFALDVMMICVVVMVVESVLVGQAKTVTNSHGVTVKTVTSALNVTLKRNVMCVDGQFVIIFILLLGNVTNVGFRPVVTTVLVLRYVPTVKRDCALDVMIMVMETSCLGAMFATSVPA